MRTFSDLNSSNEKKFLAYCIANPNESVDIEEKYILNRVNNEIYKAIQYLNSIEVIPTVHELITIVEKNPDTECTRDYIQSIIDEYIDFTNIDYVKQTLRNSYFANKMGPEILVTLLDDIEEAREINYDKVEELIENLKDTVSEVKNVPKFKTAQQLSENYLQVLEDREKGLKKRTFGYRVIDNECIRIAEAGEMTTIFAQKGVGKSTFVQNIETRLVNLQTPVLHFSLEMPEESDMDRHVTIRSNTDIKELYRPMSEKDKRSYQRAKRVAQQFSEIKNYLYVHEPGMGISDLESIVKDARKYFCDLGLLDDYGYMWVTIDLASKLKEISGEYGDGVEKGAHRLDDIAKRNGCHLCNIVQANENKLRAGLRFKSAEELDYYVLTDEDVKGGGGWSESSRMVLSLTRPLMLKKKHFPDRNEEWALEEDVIWVQATKSNYSDLFRIPFIFDPETFRMVPRYIPTFDDE